MPVLFAFLAYGGFFLFSVGFGVCPAEEGGRTPAGGSRAPLLCPGPCRAGTRAERSKRTHFTGLRVIQKKSNYSLKILDHSLEDGHWELEMKIGSVPFCIEKMHPLAGGGS